MNAETFYDDFKSALRHLGLSWGEMHLASVYLDGDKIVLAYGQYTATIAPPKVIR